MTRRTIAVAQFCTVALACAACSSNNGSPAASTTTSTSARSTTPTSGTSPTTTTIGTLAPQTATSTEFLSPSKNISCEIDNSFGPSALTQTLCLTVKPARSVVLKTDGSLVACVGQQCLSNAGLNTPTLAYGQSIALGPFRCASAKSGVTCTLSSGAGFLISSSGILPKGGATITAS